MSKKVKTASLSEQWQRQPEKWRKAREQKIVMLTPEKLVHEIIKTADAIHTCGLRDDLRPVLRLIVEQTRYLAWALLYELPENADDYILKERQTLPIDELRLNAYIETLSGALRTDALAKGDSAPVAQLLRDVAKGIADHVSASTADPLWQRVEKWIEHDRRLAYSGGIEILDVKTKCNAVDDLRPASWFKQRANIPPNTLDKARRDGRLTQSTQKKQRGGWQHSRAEVQKVFPHKFMK